MLQIGLDTFRLRRFSDESQFLIEKNGAVYALVRMVDGRHEFGGGVQGGADTADARVIMAALSAL
jgi:hypothetical protein